MVPGPEGKILLTNKAHHYTIIFHTFVMMQVFNEINSRKLGAYDYNVFAGFFNNWLFLFITFFTIGVQVFLVQYGGVIVRCTPLSLTEHLICVGIGAYSLINGRLYI